MLYASDLFRMRGTGSVGLEDNPDAMPNILAEILARAVEVRQRRHLSLGYRPREAVLYRVRGRIDVLTTERHQLLSRGRVACKFDELTIDTPRNRFVRAALEAISRIVQHELAHRCRKRASDMKAMGVSGNLPTRAQMSADRSDGMTPTIDSWLPLPNWPSTSLFLLRCPAKMSLRCLIEKRGGCVGFTRELLVGSSMSC
jgi:5-methylcytosine-specific restriction enzyme subunit McrC